MKNPSGYFTSTVETIILIDNHKRIKMMDGYFFGYKEEDILGKSIGMLFEGNELYETLFRKDIIKNFKTKFISKDKEGIPVSFSSVVIKDETGRAMGAVGIARNLNEMERLEKNFIQSEKMVTIGQFSSGIAHQLNTPLSTILTYSQMIASDIEKNILDKDVLLKRISSIEQQAQRSRGIIKHLLSFSRPHSTQFIPLDINQVIEDSVMIVEGELLNSDIQIINQLGNCPKIMGDPYQLQELIVHMVINAQQAMPNGTGGTLTITTISMPPFIKIRLKDTGEGITEQDLNTIFEPFFTNKSLGTGLGLFVCRNIVYNHNGFIDVQSKPGKGTTFTISLPITLPPNPKT